MLRRRMSGRKAQDEMGAKAVIALVIAVLTIVGGFFALSPLYAAVFGTNTIGLRQLTERADFLVHGGTAATFDSTKQGTTYARTEYLFGSNQDVLIVGFGTGQQTAHVQNDELGLLQFSSGDVTRPSSCGKEACICQFTYKAETYSPVGVGAQILKVTGQSCDSLTAGSLRIARLDPKTSSQPPQKQTEVDAVIEAKKSASLQLYIEYNPKTTPPTLLITPSTKQNEQALHDRAQALAP